MIAVRILFLGPQSCMDPFNAGGAESFVRRIAVSCIEIGHETSIVLCGALGDGCREWPFGPGPSVFRFVSLRDAMDYVRSIDPDVLVVGPLPRSQLLEFRRMSRPLRKQMQVVLLLMEVGKSPWRLLLRTIGTCGYQGPIICVSPRLLKRCRRLLLNAHLIRPPVARVFYEPRSNQSLQAGVRIAYVGRLDARKGFEELPGLFQFIARVVGGAIPLRFAVEGYYSFEKVLESTAHRKLQQLCGTDYKYRLRDDIPYSPDAERLLKETLHAVDLVLFPYLSLDGTLDVPLLPLEAAACGCAVLTTPIGGLGESLKGIVRTASIERIPNLAGSILQGLAPPLVDSAIASYQERSVASEFVRALETTTLR